MSTTSRPPIVAVMGHIDHGKSSLLDYIRKANVTASEAGGITQHVSAYEAVHTHEGTERQITFLDTPGHEAFKALRARGAAAADIAILVIAADDGVKPQTLEAFSAATEAGTPVVVAITKIDKPGADAERAKYSAVENAIYLEGVGGSIPYAPVSSKTGEGVPELLDLVLLTADLAELTARPDGQADGFVLESSQDPKRGMAATLIVKNGTLTTSSFVVAGTAIAPVRFIENFAGKRITAANPSQPVSITGWSSLPPAGTPFITVATKKEAEKLVAEASKANSPSASTSANSATDTNSITLPLVIKADVSGSLEAIRHELNKVSHERVTIRIVYEGIGPVSEGDVKTAQTGNAVIIAFTVGVDSLGRDAAQRLNVPIESFSIIYDLVERVQALVDERAPVITVEEVHGQAKILKVFSVAGNKHVMGARWESGTLAVNDMVKIDRRGIPLGQGRLTNLQQARSDVQEIKMEGEFGLQVESRVEIAAGDTIAAFAVVSKK